MQIEDTGKREVEAWCPAAGCKDGANKLLYSLNYCCQQQHAYLLIVFAYDSLYSTH